VNDAVAAGAAGLSLRRAGIEDADRVAALCTQLGYPATPAQISRRIEGLSPCLDSQAVFVASLNSTVVGWIEVSICRNLQSDPFVLISGLVVDQSARGLGIGKRLCEHAEAWARAKGIRLLRLTSRSTRAGAHRFYLRDGFTETKTSKVFEKVLGDSQPGNGAPLG
jgi:GNAT superfamily N-acetyltransferase